MVQAQAIMVDADEILPRLWQGSWPPRGGLVASEGFDVLILCASEVQPKDEDFPGVQVVHAPFDDVDISRGALEQALRASNTAAEYHREGKDVLVTCAAGMNRSGLVVALTIHRLMGWSGDACVHMVRVRRRPGFKDLPALNNQSFVNALSKIEGTKEVGAEILPTLIVASK